MFWRHFNHCGTGRLQPVTESHYIFIILHAHLPFASAGVAERPHEGSRGLQPTVPPGRGPRRGATLEHRMKSGRSLSRRSATRFPSGSIRGLKSTATVTLSLRENPPMGRAGFRPEGPSFNSLGQSLGVRANKGSSPERAEQLRFARAWFRPFRAGSNQDAIPGLCPGQSNCAPLGLGHGPRSTARLAARARHSAVATVAFSA